MIGFQKGDVMRTFAIQPDHPAARRLPGVALLLTVAAFAVYAAPPLSPWLQFSRPAIADGQWWRLFTCHWTHWSLDHLMWDALVFVVLGILCERISRARMVVCLVVSAAAIPSVVWWLNPGLENYRGLSGLDSALFTLLLVALARSAIAERRWCGVAISMVMLAMFGGKVIYETVTGATIFADHVAGGFEPVPLAHAVGAVAGLVCGLVSPPTRRAAGQERRSTPFAYLAPLYDRVG